MKINILASSSDGNCTHVSTNESSILIDAGISAKKIFALSDTTEFDAVFISHEHGDHVRGLGPLGRKTDIKIYMHELIYNKVQDTLKDCDVTLWKPGEEITIGDLKINNFSTRHDAIYSYGFTVDDGHKKLGYLTDSGSWTKLMAQHLIGCDGYILEADYDYESLMNFEFYDDYLKERISSRWGHMGNEQTMSLIKSLNITDPEFIIFAHLSPRTNTPELVKKAALDAFPDWDESLFHIAPIKITLE